MCFMLLIDGLFGIGATCLNPFESMTLAEVMATLLIMPDCMSTEVCCLYPN